MQSIKQIIDDYTIGEMKGKYVLPIPPSEPTNGRKQSAGVTERGFGDLSTSHMVEKLFIYMGEHKTTDQTINEKALFESAVIASWNWDKARKDRQGLSFVLVSGAIPPQVNGVDMIVTDENGRELPVELFDGFGCGKTTIAEILYSSCKRIAVEEDVNGRKIQELQAAPADDPVLVYVSNQMGKTIDEARQELINAYREQANQFPPRTQTIYTGRFFTSADLIEKLAGGRDDNGHKIDERAGAIIGEDSEVVVIDDIGREGVLPYVSKEMQTAEMQNRYYRVIDFVYRRFKNGKPCPSLILTSNMRVDELKQFLGGANWTRLEEMAPEGYIHDLTGVRNYRLIPRLLGVQK